MILRWFIGLVTINVFCCGIVLAIKSVVVIVVVGECYQIRLGIDIHGSRVAVNVITVVGIVDIGFESVVAVWRRSRWVGVLPLRRGRRRLRCF